MLDGARVSDEQDESVGEYAPSDLPAEHQEVPMTEEDSPSQHMSLADVFARPEEHTGESIEQALDDVPVDTSGPSRSRRHRQHKVKRQRRRGRIVVVLSLLLIVCAGVGGWYGLRPLITDTFGVADYAGAGTGDVTVHVEKGDTASAIAATLYKAGVVRSEEAFVDAATANPDSTLIAPGSYRLHKEMKASLAVKALLDPSAKVSVTVTLPEGSTQAQIFAKLAAGLGLSAADLAAAATPSAVGLPDSYNTSAAPVTSLEGFLFPDTYIYDFGTTPAAALAPLIDEFARTDRTLSFTPGAAAVGLTPYQALIVASMVEGEAKFDEDRPKVARVILNRLAAHEHLGIDATSVYGAILAGRDPKKLTYNEDDPYNTRNRQGLPPTPIGNPGAQSMDAVVHPATGDWTHYVNGDADGHLTFTDEAGFGAAVGLCRQNHWGCD
jgi:UPF0755 protein